jgi:hypothetical protein
MARKKKVTVDEYITGRDDMTHVLIAESEFGYEIVLRLDGTYSSAMLAEEQAKFVSKTLGIPMLDVPLKRK